MPTPEQKARYAAKQRERRAADPEKYREEWRNRTPEQMAAYAARTREARAADPEKYRERDRDRHGPVRRAQWRDSHASDPEVVAERNRRYRNDNLDRVRALGRAWYQDHPERKKAHHEVEKAIRNGVLVRPDRCSQCGKECKPDAAHTDYTKPLDVLWLCRKCHMRMDKDPERGDS